MSTTNSLYKVFSTDAQLEKEGIILSHGLFNSKGKPIEFRIARAGGTNKRYLDRMEAKTKPLRRQIQTETIERSTLEAVIREVFAETVVLGWTGVELPVLDAQGNKTGEMAEAPFTKENCIRLFNDLPDLFTEIQEQAQKSALFRAEILENDGKN